MVLIIPDGGEQTHYLFLRVLLFAVVPFVVLLLAGALRATALFLTAPFLATVLLRTGFLKPRVRAFAFTEETVLLRVLAISVAD